MKANVLVSIELNNGETDSILKVKKAFLKVEAKIGIVKIITTPKQYIPQL